MAKSSLAEFFHPPIIPPGPPRIPPMKRTMAHNDLLFCDQNFDHFLVSIFARFGLVLGSQLGVIFGTFGAQDRPSSVLNAFCKPINMKNVKIHEILRLLIPERHFGTQDGSQNVPRSAQDGSKRFLKISIFRC